MAVLIYALISTLISFSALQDKEYPSIIGLAMRHGVAGDSQFIIIKIYI